MTSCRRTKRETDRKGRVSQGQGGGEVPSQCVYGGSEGCHVSLPPSSTPSFPLPLTHHLGGGERRLRHACPVLRTTARLVPNTHTALLRPFGENTRARPNPPPTLAVAGFFAVAAFFARARDVTRNFMPRLVSFLDDRLQL